MPGIRDDGNDVPAPQRDFNVSFVALAGTALVAVLGLVLGAVLAGVIGGTPGWSCYAACLIGVACVNGRAMRAQDAGEWFVAMAWSALWIVAVSIAMGVWSMQYWL